MSPDRWPEIDRLFHEALERRPDERAAFLDEACADDAALRREVESLLSHDGGAAAFLQRPALQQAAEQIVREIDFTKTDPEIPGYRLLRTLGEGGMGVVYLAEQLAPIHRQVALKLIKYGMDTRQVVARFDMERQALALMHHPHIAAVFDAGVTVDGRPYFAMEYVEGEPITDYSDRRRLSTRGRLELFVQVCLAVQHAHQKGVIHRDLKPSNIVVTEEDGRPVPKIIDFGVAKAIDRALVARSAFTEHGMMVGTPEYMSPEQAAFSPDIDTTTDVYSLGVLLYELLLGTLPFDSKRLRAAGYDEMRRLIRESDPLRPSARLTSPGFAADTVAAARRTDAGRLTRELRGDLDWITLKALEKDRQHRYATAAAFAADVAHYLADEPIAARPPSAVYRLRKFSRRYRTAVLAAAGVFLALVIGLIVSVTQYIRAESQRAQSEMNRTAAEAASHDAATQRNAAVSATDEANRLRIVATADAAAANDARRVAEYRAYLSTIAAADAELRLGFAVPARARLLAVPDHLREWEWDHLFLKTDTSLVTLTSTVPCAGPGDAGNWDLTGSDGLVAVGNGGRVYLRRCATLEVWDGSAYTHATFQTPGRILTVDAAGHALVVEPAASGTSPQWSLRLIDPATNRALSQFGPFDREPLCADLNRDNTRLAVGLRPPRQTVSEPLRDVFEVWDASAARRLSRLAPPPPLLTDTRNSLAMSCLVTFSPDSTRLATSGATVHVWQTASGAEVARDATQAGFVSQPIAWNPDGSRLAIGRLSGFVDLLDLATTPRFSTPDGNGYIRVLPMPDKDRGSLVLSRKQDVVLSVAFSPDGARVTAGRHLGVDVWDVAQHKLAHVLLGHGADVVGVAVDPAGRIVSADTSGAVKIWSASLSAAMTVLLPGSGSPSAEFALSAKGDFVGVGQMDGALYAWRLSDLHQTTLATGRGRSIGVQAPFGLAVSPDGRQLLEGHNDEVGTVSRWDLGSRESTTTTVNTNQRSGCQSVAPFSTRPWNGVSILEISPDGRWLALRQGPCVVVRDLSTMAVVATLPHAQAGVASSLAFRPDGALVMTAYHYMSPPRSGPGQAKVLIWDWRHDRVLAQAATPATKTADENSGWHVTVSPDGRYIAALSGAGGRPAICQIWDGDLRRDLGRFPVPAETRWVAFSRDGRRLASTGGDTNIRIWDVEQKQLLLMLSDDDRHLGGLAFADGGRLIAARASGGLTIWETNKTLLSRVR